MNLHRAVNYIMLEAGAKRVLQERRAMFPERGRRLGSREKLWAHGSKQGRTRREREGIEEGG